MGRKARGCGWQKGGLVQFQIITAGFKGLVNMGEQAGESLMVERIDIFELLRVLQRRYKLIVGFIIVAVLMAYAYLSSVTPLYKVTVGVSPPMEGVVDLRLEDSVNAQAYVFGMYLGNLSERQNIDDFLALHSKTELEIDALSRIRVEPPKRGSKVGSYTRVTILGEAESPAALEAIFDQYIKFTIEVTSQQVQALATDRLNKEIAILDIKVDRHVKALAQYTEGQSSGVVAGLVSLQGERDSLATIRDSLTSVSVARVVQAVAALPRPVFPRVELVLGSAVFFGFLFGSLLALVLHARKKV